MDLDPLDRLAATAFDGYLVRKDLVRRYSRQFPVPTYVVEFLLGRYCATVDETEIEEGLKIVQRQLEDRIVREGEAELFKARAREKGSAKLIDIVKARLDQKSDCFLVESPSLQLRDVRISDKLVHENERMLTDSECWTRLRDGSRVTTLQGRVNWGGALSGRDIEAVNKTISGLVKLLYPDAKAEVPDEALEQIVKLALEVRRRVKEQQKRVFKTEFRNSHLSYFMGVDGVEQFVATPELHSDDSIDTDPLPPGQVWAISPGSGESSAGLYRIEVNCGPGSGVKILNNPKPPAFSESVRYAEQNLYTRAKELVGDRDARSHEFSVQLRAIDADKSGAGLGLPVLVALVSSLLERNSKGGVILAGGLNLGGSVEMIQNPVALAELAYEKGAATLLLPVSARKQLLSLSDEIATKLNIEFYSESVDAVFKALEQ